MSERREIKFRVWRDGMMHRKNVMEWETLGFCLNGGDGAIAMQSTGIMDRFGNPIFDGDIIVTEGYPWFDGEKPNYVAVVEWFPGCFCTVKHCVNPDKRGISSGIAEQLEDGMDWIVLGNIYENPELLEARKE